MTVPPSPEPTRPMPRSPRTALEPERVPPPVRRSRRGRHPLIVAANVILTLVTLIGLAAAAAVFIVQEQLAAPGPLQQEKIVNIPRGSGMRDISDQLAREGVIDYPAIFIASVVTTRRNQGLKYGEYKFAPAVSMREVIEMMAEGRVVEYFFTVPEGLTSQQIVARLTETEALAGTLRENPREGTLLPETYKFTRGTSREQMVARMQQAHRRIVAEAWERRNPDLPIKTQDQLITLASIVEKETGKPEERTRVAAVFVNRLKNKMRLQSDPTIIYGLSGGRGTLGRPIMRSEIEQPTPYNTYTIDGLPPGPIANPGRASIEATANPARTKELYFVADGTGGHVFADNYEQHQRNVARLRVIEREQGPQTFTQPALPGPARSAPAR